MKVNTYTHSSEDAYEEVRKIFLISFFVYEFDHLSTCCIIKTSLVIVI